MLDKYQIDDRRERELDNCLFCKTEFKKVFYIILLS